MAEPDDDAEPQIALFIPQDRVPGVWANWAAVSHSPYEFTLDFGRLEFDGDTPTGGMIVQRVSVSPLLVTQLIEALKNNWDAYAQKALPPEARSMGTEGD